MAKRPIPPIRSAADYEAAIDEIEEYFEKEPKQGTPEADRFDLLALIIEDYEKKYWPMDIVDVTSSAINRIRYQPKGRKLLVTFVSGKTYAYEGVPEQVYDAFLAAPSHGVFFNENIRDRYSYRLVEG
jgi:hypothetical protein